MIHNASIISFFALALAATACTESAGVRGRTVDRGSGGEDGSGGEGNSVGSAGSVDVGDRDEDDDKRIGDADCDPDDGTIFRGAPEVCGDGLDNDCDGLIDEKCDHGDHSGSDDSGGEGGSGGNGGGGGEEPNDDDAQESDGDTPGVHLLVIEVSRPSETPGMEFSWGYCSDVDNPADCHDWHEDASRVLWDRDISQDIRVLEMGWVRFNTAFFLEGSDISGERITGDADAWLCEGRNANADLTATFNAWLDGKPMSNETMRRAVRLATVGGGCSAAINVAVLVGDN